MRLLVCGGRDYEDREFVYEVLDDLHAERRIAAVIHGDARGADRLARDWARSRGVPDEAYPADWQKHGKRAGRIRNMDMLLSGSDGVLAFPGGNGTAHMVSIARKAGVKVRAYHLPEATRKPVQAPSRPPGLLP